jgi:hypothetical protein
VEVVAVASQKLATSFTLPAQLIPFESVSVYPKVTGFVDMVRVDRGSRVYKGELIVRLSAPELVAQRGQAESAIRAAESQLSAAKDKLSSDKGTYLHLASAAKTPGVVAENDVMVASQTASLQYLFTSPASERCNKGRHLGGTCGPTYASGACGVCNDRLGSLADFYIVGLLLVPILVESGKAVFFCHSFSWAAASG